MGHTSKTCFFLKLTVKTLCQKLFNAAQLFWFQVQRHIQYEFLYKCVADYIKAKQEEEERQRRAEEEENEEASQYILYVNGQNSEPDSVYVIE